MMSLLSFLESRLKMLTLGQVSPAFFVDVLHGFAKCRWRARFIEERGLKLTYFVYVVVFKKLINVS
jgi:hypothetical protein